MNFNNNQNNIHYGNHNYNSDKYIYQSGTGELTFKNYITKMFAIVALGIFTSALIAFLININFINIINTFGNSFLYVMYGCGIFQIVVVLYLSYKLSKGVKFGFALGMFVFYSALTGITLSAITFVYKPSEILHAFLVTGLFFTALCIIGHITNYKLLKFGNMIAFALLFFLIVQIISLFFFPSIARSMLMDFIAIAIFAFYSVYDFQRVKYMFENSRSKRDLNTAMISGALSLYLDFINLFIRILSLLSREK